MPNNRSQKKKTVRDYKEKEIDQIYIEKLESIICFLRTYELESYAGSEHVGWRRREPPLSMTEIKFAMQRLDL
jgi:hypothetical protein